MTGGRRWEERQLARAVARIGEAWRGDSVAEPALALAALFGSAASHFQFDHDGGEASAVTFDAREAAPFDEEALDAIRSHRRFGARADTDPHANRPVTMSDLYGRNVRALERFRRAALSRFGITWQLRVTLYDDGGAIAGHVALLRGAAHGDFDEAHVRLLQQLVPVLRDGASSRAHLASRAVAASELLSLLDEWDEAVFVLSRARRVVWANHAARSLTHPPSWLARAAAGDRRGVPADARVRDVDVGGALHTIVLAGREATSGGKAALPPRLARVASLAARGLTDKEIASRAGLSIATVRTYMTQIYRRTGVHHRAALARIMLASRRGQHR
jgi:DNA-binding CsgD family transcriptional regulator